MCFTEPSDRWFAMVPAGRRHPECKLRGALALLQPAILVACAVVVPQACFAAHGIVFTTSVRGTGNLSSWPAAAEADAPGLDAGDAICQARALSAGLPEPQTFVAWLSDGQDDAYCRLLGLSGKRAQNCGSQGPLPEAGPWVRTDGLPFGESLSALVDGRVLSPVALDEFGHPIPATNETFTGTDSTGRLLKVGNEPYDCHGWTVGTFDNESSASLGTNTGTTESWTYSGLATSCDAKARLLCLQRGSGSPLPDRPTEGKSLAFLTTGNVGGNLGGVAGADAVCKAAAANAGLTDAQLFKALLIPPGSAASVQQRFRWKGPWYRLDGMPFVASIAHVATGQLKTPLNVTEVGAYVGYAVALTGAEESGAGSGIDCSGWTSNAGLADGSLVNQTSFAYNPGSWLGPAQVQCTPVLGDNDWPKKLYCLSDPGLFGDGYE